MTAVILAAAAPNKGSVAMTKIQVGYFVGSLSSTSINRVLSRALIRLAAADLEFTEIPIGNLPLYSPDYDRLPTRGGGVEGRDRTLGRAALRHARVQPLDPRRVEERHRLGVTSVGRELFHHVPAAVIGASIGQIGTAVAQQSLRGVLSFCNARQMTAPEAYIHYSACGLP